MEKTCKFILILLVISIIFPVRPTFSMSPDKKESVSPIETAVRRQVECNEFVRVNKLLDKGIIKISSGMTIMTILDIDTGARFFAYEFAKKLNGTGKVFVMEVRPY